MPEPIASDLWLYRRLTTAVVHDYGRHLPRRDVDVDENGRQCATAARVTASMLRHRSSGPVASAFVLGHPDFDSDADGGVLPRWWAVLSIVVNNSSASASEVPPELL